METVGEGETERRCEREREGKKERGKRKKYMEQIKLARGKKGGMEETRKRD